METAADEARSTQRRRNLLLLINGFILCIGNVGGPLMTRLYFVRGGTRIWFSSSLLNAAWPLTLLALAVAYFLRRKAHGGGPAKAKFFFMTPKIFAATAVVGAVNGLDSFLYASGLSKLPISTSALLIATQLAFTACFASLLVKQKFTPYSVNAIVLLTMGAGVLAFGSSSDRPAGESGKEYVIAFAMTILAASLAGFLLPATELVFRQAKQAISYTLVLEIQVVMCFSATVFCIIGMIADKDFQALSMEAREFGKGGNGKDYVVVVIWTAILWQICSIGAVGVICYGSSLLSGVLMAMLLSVTEVLGLVFFGERFRAQKGISLALSLWGFVSYFYGELKSSNTANEDPADHSPI